MLQRYICWKFWESKFSKWWRESERYKSCYFTLPFSHKGAPNMLSDTAFHSKGFHACIFNQDYISHTSIIARKCRGLVPLENISALCVCCQLFFFFVQIHCLVTHKTMFDELKKMLRINIENGCATTLIKHLFWDYCHANSLRNWP